MPGALGRFRAQRPSGRLRSRRGWSRTRIWLRNDGRLERGARFGVEVVVVAAEVRDERSAVDLDDPGRDAIDEVAVVGDEDDRARKRGEGLLEDFTRGEIEMVRRLVHAEERRGPHEHFRERDARLFAA